MSLTDTDVRTTHTATLPLCRPTPPPTILQYYLISKPCSVSPNCLKKVFLWLVYTDQNPSIIHPLYLANMLLNIFLSIKISPPFFFIFFFWFCASYFLKIWGYFSQRIFYHLVLADCVLQHYLICPLTSALPGNWQLISEA